MCAFSESVHQPESSVLFHQGLFRNHGESVLEALKPHLDRLSDDMTESSQKCLCEILAGQSDACRRGGGGGRWDAPRRTAGYNIVEKTHVKQYAYRNDIET